MSERKWYDLNSLMSIQAKPEQIEQILLDIAMQVVDIVERHDSYCTGEFQATEKIRRW